MTQLLSLLAGLALAASTEQIQSEVGELKDAIASPASSELHIREKGRDIFDRVHAAKIKVHVNVRGWDFGPKPLEEEADAKRLMTSARRRLSDLNVSVPRDLTHAMKYAEDMTRSNKVEMDSTLKENTMGVYQWLKSELGDIKLNKWLAGIATQIGDTLAFATLAHEAAHARDHQAGSLDSKEVVEGEVRAFKTQYHWLKIADPYGERVAWLRTKLMHHQRENPNALTHKSLQYLEHLAKLHDTEGDERKIREMVKALGYEDGHDHRDDDAPHSA